MKLTKTIIAKISSPTVYEGAVAITTWSFPWVIVTCIVLLYKDQVSILQDISFAKVLIPMCAFYVLSSFCSFKGFILPIFLGKDLSALHEVRVPEVNEQILPKDKRLLKKHRKNHYDSSLYSDIIVIHDFLSSIQEQYSDPTLFSYIPTIDQMREYPYESLKLMLSAHRKIQKKYNDKYYNFELIVNTCLSKK